MSIALWVVAVVVGFGLSAVASSRTVTHASALAHAAGVPPFLIGITVLAVGTDLPEIANSIVASASGHGDLNVGDSVGSAATQATLVLGLLPFLAGAFATPGRRPFATGLFAVLALSLTVVLVADDFLSRTDGALLVGIWMVGSWATYRLLGRTPEDEVDPADLDTRTEDTTGWALLGRTLVGLITVGLGASLAVFGAIEIAEELGVSEFLIAFFALSIGTSLPELMVALTAVRQGEPALAVGDIVGSSFADTTLSVGVGPLLFPVAVTSSEVVPAVIAAAVAIGAITIMLIRVDRHTRATGAFALGIYALFYLVLL